MNWDVDRYKLKAQYGNLLSKVMIRFLLLSIAFLMPLFAKAQIFLNPWEPHLASHELWQLQPELSIFSSSSNYSDDAVPVVGTTFTSYKRTQLQVGIEYGITDRITAYSLLRAAQVSVSNGAASRSASGLTDQTFGVSIRFWQPEEEYHPDFSQFVAFQLQGDFATYNNIKAENAGKIFLGDGSTDGVAGGVSRIRLFQSPETLWSIVVGAGLQFRSDAFSKALPWIVQVQYRKKPLGLFFDFGIDGLQSFATDKTSPISAVTQARIINASSGSYFTNAINPSLLDLRIKVGNWFSPTLAASLQFLTTIRGQTAPKGIQIAGAATFRFGVTPSPVENRPRKKITSVPGFATYDMEATILSVSDRFHVLKINRGKNDGVALTDTFDIVESKTTGKSGTLVARGKVTSLKEEEAVITVQEYYREVWIQPGFIAKRVME